MVRFVYGDLGCGKTEYIMSCLAADAEAGIKSFLIVPEQQTVSAERDALLRLPPSSQLTLEVLNFSRLANRIFRERGGLAYNYATPGLRRLIMWRALREVAPVLSEYGGRALDDRTLPEAMLGTVKELKACGVTPLMLDDACESMPSGSPLSRKLRDLSCAASVYGVMLGEKFSDASDDLSRLCGLLDDEPYFTGMHVYIDSFSSLTGQEHAVLRRIMSQAALTVITVGIPSPAARGIDTLSLRACSDRLRRDAASFGGECETLTLGRNLRTLSPELRVAAADLWRLDSAGNPADAVPEEERGQLELWQALDRYDESEAVAARVRALLEDGMRCRDIVIVARDAGKYRGIIEPALENMDIPCFLSEKTELASGPLARLILSALRVRIYGWRRDDVIAHLKTGLCGISPRDCDLFECYAAKWRISGRQFTDGAEWNMNPDGYTDRHSERGDEILAAANAVREWLRTGLTRYFAGLDAAGDCAGMCRETVMYLDSLGVRERLSALAARELGAGRQREAGEAARMYDAVIDALEGVADAFEGAPKPDIRTFASAIGTVLEASEIGTIPTSSDEVTVGSADMLRAGSVRCVIIAGVCDGEFPAGGGSPGLLSDDDREELAGYGITLSGDRAERAADELYFFRRALAAASERVIVYTRTSGDSGGSCRPSVAFERLRTMFPYINVRNASADCTERLRTVRTGSEYLPLLDGTAAGEALKNALDGLPGGDRPGFPDCPVDASGDSIEPDTAALMYQNRISLSQSQIESYVNCRFSYCCRYLLRLDDGKRAEFAYNSIGTFVHYVLEKYLLRVYSEDGMPDAAGREALLDEIIGNYINEFIPAGDGGGKSARLSHLVERMRALSSLLIDDICAEFDDSDFRPEFFELPVGRDGIPALSFTLADGTEITLNGIADRVDVFRRDGKAYIRVVDYKTGSKVFSPADIRDGMNLQLLLYLFSLTRAAGASRLFGADTPVPAAIEYLSSYQQPVPVRNLSDGEGVLRAAASGLRRSGLILDDPDISAAVSRSGNPRYLMSRGRQKSAVSPEGLELIFNELGGVLTLIASEMKSGRAEACPNPNGKGGCDYCPYSSVCRTAK